MANRNGTPARLQVDFAVENHFSVFLFRMNTPAAHAWVSENVQEDAQFFGDALVVEHRYAADLIHGLQNDGFVVALATGAVH